MAVIEKIEALIKPPIESLGLSLFEVTLTLEQGEKFLRVLIEKPKGRIGLQEIIQVTQLINPLLDQADIIPEHYVLDVASAGVEHPIHLDELPQYIQRFVYLHLMHPFEGENLIEGKLMQIQEDEIQIEVMIKARKRVLTIKRKDIDYARLAVAMK
ncbi:MAG: ribosome maturation factor RimP [Bacillota bacterium]|jgi:ribosome maturation factor RimP